MFGLGAPELLIILVLLVIPALVIGLVVFAVVKANRSKAPRPVLASGSSPGWHPDPDGTPGALRYWDGTQWTEQRATST